MLRAVSRYIRWSVRFVLEVRRKASFLGLAVALIFSMLLVAFAALSLSVFLEFLFSGLMPLEGPLFVILAIPVLPYWFAATIILFEDYFVLIRLRSVVFGDQPLFRERLEKWSSISVKETCE